MHYSDLKFGNSTLCVRYDDGKSVVEKSYAIYVDYVLGYSDFFNWGGSVLEIFALSYDSDNLTVNVDGIIIKYMKNMNFFIILNLILF